jgi:hypothetical protein
MKMALLAARGTISTATNKWRQIVIVFGLICSLAMLFYICAFVWRFDVFGEAVRDNKHGWLGPTIRGDSHTMDIGEVGYYEGTDFSLYRTYRPLCGLWLSVTGFSN